MHGKILCVSTLENSGTCEENYELIEKLECDYIGDNCPDETEGFINDLLKDCFEWHPNNQEVDEDNTCQGYLIVKDNAKDIALKMWEGFQDKVANYTFDKAYLCFGDYFQFLDGFNVRCSDYVIMFEDRVQSLFSFIVDMDRYYNGQKLYVNGCVDYHF